MRWPVLLGALATRYREAAAEAAAALGAAAPVHGATASAGVLKDSDRSFLSAASLAKTLLGCALLCSGFRA
jgi:hypothetical protein